MHIPRHFEISTCFTSEDAFVYWLYVGGSQLPSLDI